MKYGPNASSAAAPEAQTYPTALLSPTVDGDETSYFEWLGAGSLEIHETAGAMHRSDRRTPLLTLVQFGFDRERRAAAWTVSARTRS